jgi:flagellar hook-basal body complex protein FliE
MSVSSINAFIRPGGMIQFLPPAVQSLEINSPIPAAELKQLPGAAASDKVAAPSFSNALHSAIQDVNTKQVAASDAVNGLMAGQNVPLHQAMVAMEEASVSFQLMVEVRNRLLESYQELMRMQV